VRRCARAGLIAGAAAIALIAGNRNLQSARAEGDTRTISFHHVHTGEDITITYKRSGRYDEAALKKLDWFLRDWRKEKAVDMDPHLIDLLWEVNREVGGKQPIQVICGYRSPGTNAMLRARSSGVAQYSLHSKGDAIDFYIPGVPLAKIREVGLQLQRGGVGFYPTSGSPFVHLDTGAIRHWPRIARAQLKKVFPDGRTVHVPSDGVPLSRYAQALADVERHGHVPSALSLAQARNAGAITAHQEQVADAMVERPSQRAALAVFDFGSRGEQANEQLAGAAPARPARTHRPSVVAGLSATATFVPPLPKGRPALNAVLAEMIPTPHRRPALPREVTGTDPVVTASAGGALAYAGEASAFGPAYAAPRVRPMGNTVAATPPAVAPASSTFDERFTAAATTTATQAGYRFDNPWLRAAVLTPNVSEYMTALRTGHSDARQLAPFLHKPTSPVLLMGFSPDPTGGLGTGAFSGRAVVFLATLSSPVHTAWLEPTPQR
jgi:uncharacterized protein YcbK (DUF882 family)